LRKIARPLQANQWVSRKVGTTFLEDCGQALI
jgi:hypothetical protein